MLWRHALKRAMARDRARQRLIYLDLMEPHPEDRAHFSSWQDMLAAAVAQRAEARRAIEEEMKR